MLDLLIQSPLIFIIIVILLILAVTIHEFSHAKAADHLGDPTPRLAGRLTLNPVAHLDPLGSLLFVIAGFGWGKPVPFDPFNLKNPKKDAALISFAGPFSNVVMAIATSLILRIIYNLPFFFLGSFLENILILFIRFNVLLAVFNLIPVHPLDGFKVVAGLLPKKYYHDWLDLQRYGMIFLLFLILPFFGSSPIIAIINPITNLLLSFLLPAGTGGVI